MTALQAFWHLLYALQHSTTSAEAVDPATGAVRYGGHALQAFVIALFNHLELVWLDNAS